MTGVSPPAVRPGDSVAVVAPAGPVEPAPLARGIAWLETHYRPVVDPCTRERTGYFAGPDERRRGACQAALDNTDFTAVLTARGGYGTSRILDRLDFTGLKRTPKWIVGSSDVTAMLIALYARLGLVTIHGPMVDRFGALDPRDLSALIDLLEGRTWAPPKTLRPVVGGEATGPLVGGNLTVMAHLIGSISPDFADGAVLFLEDVGEQPYRLDRSLTQLSRAGLLSRVAGVVLGAFTGCDPGPDGVTADAVMEANLAPLGIPVAAGYPAAHGSRNYPFPHGKEVGLRVSGGRAELFSI